MKYKTGLAKQKRDERIRYYHVENPLATDKEIGKRFGLERSTVTRILQNHKIKGEEVAK